MGSAVEQMRSDVESSVYRVVNKLLVGHHMSIAGQVQSVWQESKDGNSQSELVFKNVFVVNQLN